MNGGNRYKKYACGFVLFCFGYVFSHNNMIVQITWIHRSNGYTEITQPEQNCHNFSDDIFICIFWLDVIEFWVKFHWNLFPKIQLAKKATMCLAMVCRQKGNKLLPEPKLTEFCEAMWRRLVTMSFQSQQYGGQSDNMGSEWEQQV